MKYNFLITLPAASWDVFKYIINPRRLLKAFQQERFFKYWERMHVRRSLLEIVLTFRVRSRVNTSRTGRKSLRQRLVILRKNPKDLHYMALGVYELMEAGARGGGG